jgi:hypothetical protein
MRRLLLITTCLVALSSPAFAPSSPQPAPSTEIDCSRPPRASEETPWHYKCVKRPTTVEEEREDAEKRLEGKLTPLEEQGRRNTEELGGQHMENERRNIERARRNDPRSNQSTITGPIRSNRLKGGGTAPNKISRPAFLGGSGGRKGGIELGGEVHGQSGNLDGIHDAIKELPR